MNRGPPGSAQQQTVVGATPNLAARLQGIAEPNTVVIAETTRKMLGNLFEMQDLGAQDLKGIGGRVRAWVALRPSSVESRFEALHGAGLTALVGREEELELLSRRWSRAKSGEGQVVLLSGEAAWPVRPRRAFGGSCPTRHWKTITFVAALRRHGMRASQTIDGSMTGKKFLDVILEVDRHAVNTPADVRNMVKHDRRVDLNEIVIRARTDIAPLLS